MNKRLPPFDPTTCACKADRNLCKRQPGHLLPGQLQKIADYLGKSLKRTKKLFWNSPGMILENPKDKSLTRIRTITPVFRKGRCIFLDKRERCKIHPVAPFGCRYFDVHMDYEEGQKRSHWGLDQILGSAEEYQRERDSLEQATHWKPDRGPDWRPDIAPLEPLRSLRRPIPGSLVKRSPPHG